VTPAGLRERDAVAPWARPEPYRPPGTRFVGTIIAIGGIVLAVFAGALAWTAWNDRPPDSRPHVTVAYERFLALVRADAVQQIYYDNPTGVITGSLAEGQTEEGHSHFETRGPTGSLPTRDVILLVDHHVVIGSETGGPQPAERNRDPWWVFGLEWLQVLQVTFVVLAIVAVVGLIRIRHRAA